MSNDPTQTELSEAVSRFRTTFQRIADEMAHLIVRTIPGPNTFGTRPSPTDKVAYGKYMTSAALCSDCHTPIDDRGTPLPGVPNPTDPRFVSVAPPLAIYGGVRVKL